MAARDGFDPAAGCLAGPPAGAAVPLGVLQIGAARIALPLDVLREVFPRPPAFSALPAAATGLLGAVTLRGKVLPVLDLRPVLQMPAPMQDGQVVAVLRHGGAELGLLADSVCGLTRSAADASGRMACDGGALLFSGSFERAEDQTVVSLLDPQALMRLPGLPRLCQPVAGSDGQPPRARLSERVPVMLVRCGALRLAIGVSDIHTTLPRVALQPSSMDGEVCRGVLHHAGMAVPAVDPLALLQLGALPPGAPCEALLLKLPAGFVALLVSQVIDIANVQPADLLALPPLAVRRPAMFRATLRVAGHGEHLVLATGALLHDPDLVAFAGLNTRLQTAPAAAALASAAKPGAAAPAAGHAVLTYDIGTEVATRLTQVSEVMAPPGDRSRPDSAHPAVVGLFTHRGHAVTLVCLSTLLHGQAPPETATAQVLLVAHGQTRVGFLVRRLCHIDETVWEAPRRAAGDGTRPALGLHAVVELGHGTQRRSLQLIDLQALAAALVEGEGAPGPAAAVDAVDVGEPSLAA